MYNPFAGTEGQGGIALASDPLDIGIKRIDIETLGRNTGQRDKNGIIIFSGDTCTIAGIQCAVVWCAPWAQFMLALTTGALLGLNESMHIDIEVTGTIYDKGSVA